MIMRIRSSVLLGLLCLTIPIVAQWQKTPNPQMWFDVKSIALQDSRLLVGITDYESSDRGGVFLTTDNGDTWSRLLGSTSIEVVLPVEDHMFAGTTFGGLMISHDAGVTWNRAPIDGEGHTILALTQKSGVVFSSVINGSVPAPSIIRTTDFGATWTASETGLEGIQIYSLATVGDILLAGARGLGGDPSTGGIYRSADNGLTWTNTMRDGITVHSFTSNAHTIFAGTTRGVYRSTDAGLTWTASNSGLTSLRTNSIAALGTIILAGTQSGGVFRSSDNGDTWSPYGAGLSDPAVRSVAIAPGKMFAGIYDGLWRQIDAVLPIPAPSNLTASVSSGTVHLQWNRVGDARVTEYRVYGGTSPTPATMVGAIPQSTSDPVTYSISGILPGSTVYYRLTASDGSLLESAYSNEVEVSIPAAATFGVLRGTVIAGDVPKANVKLKLFDTLLTPLGWTATDSSGIYTFDSLATGEYYLYLVEPFKYITKENPRRVSVMVPETTTADFMLAKVGSDSTHHWKGYWRHQFLSWVRLWVISNEFVQELLRYVFDFVRAHWDKFPMLRSFDSFDDWLAMFATEDFSSVRQLAEVELGTLVLNFASGGIPQDGIATADNRTFGDVALYCSKLINDDVVTNDELARTLAASCNEGREIPEGLVPAAENVTGVPAVQQVPESFGLLSNYPNPFNPATVISYQLPANQGEALFVGLRVYDALGREVAVVVDGVRAPGMHTATFDATRLPSGVYTARLMVLSLDGTKLLFQQSRKMMLVK